MAITSLVPIAVFLSATLIFWALVTVVTERRAIIRERLREYAGVSAIGVGGVDVALAKPTLERPTVDSVLRKWSLIDRINLDLVRANLHLQVGEYLLVRAALAGVLAFLIFFVTNAWVLALIFAVIGYFAPRFYVRHLYDQRLRRLEQQLLDVCNLLANALRSGQGFLQGLEAVRRELPPPASEEFGQVVREISLGVDTATALSHLLTRMRSYDLDLMVTAITVQRQVGGNLAEILDSIAETVRERVRLLGEVRALTAEVRISSYILSALPFVTGLALAITSTAYISQPLTSTAGLVMTAITAVMMFIGMVLLRKLSRIEV